MSLTRLSNPRRISSAGIATARGFYGTNYGSIREGLVAYWPMNESASSGDVTAADWTGRGNDLTSNNTVPSVTGKIGDGRNFTAANSEWLSASGANNDLKFADGNDWTFAGWIWMPTWTLGIYFCGNDSSGNREVLFDTRASDGNNLACQINPGGSFGVTTIAGASMATSTWHFFAWTYNATTRALYGRVNDGIGKNSAITTRPSGSMNQSSQPLNLGRRQFTGAHSYFGGYLDEVAKWNRVLSSSELDAIWNAGNGIDLRT
jgi:hypothetical protein